MKSSMCVVIVAVVVSFDALAGFSVLADSDAHLMAARTIESVASTRVAGAIFCAVHLAVALWAGAMAWVANVSEKAR